jgi:hypothetical protein
MRLRGRERSCRTRRQPSASTRRSRCSRTTTSTTVGTARIATPHNGMRKLADGSRDDEPISRHRMTPRHRRTRPRRSALCSRRHPGPCSGSALAFVASAEAEQSSARRSDRSSGTLNVRPSRGARGSRPARRRRAWPARLRGSGTSRRLPIQRSGVTGCVLSVGATRSGRRRGFSSEPCCGMMRVARDGRCMLTSSCHSASWRSKSSVSAKRRCLKNKPLTQPTRFSTEPFCSGLYGQAQLDADAEVERDAGEGRIPLGDHAHLRPPRDEAGAESCDGRIRFAAVEVT